MLKRVGPRRLSHCRYVPTHRHVGWVARVVTALGIAGLLYGHAATTNAAVDVSDFAGVTILPVDHSGPGGTVDWRTKGSVTPVKDEGQCDASWAFGITGLVEGFHQISTGSLVSLSEQQLVDCDAFGTACAGGRPVGSLRRMIAQGGLESEAAYPYTAVPGTCKFNPAHVVAMIPGAGRVPPGDELSLQAYVAKTGPVLALIDASHASFELYTSGIYYEPDCSSTNPTRAVLVVGYGSTSGSDYWIVKNSFGTSWGDAGYIRMSRNRNNNCGIASFALVAADLPIRNVVVNAAPVLSPTALVALVVVIAGVALTALRRATR